MQARRDSFSGSGPRPGNDANMRVSDAERNDIAEKLSKHYGEGRLDATEFQERLERAMGAKTRADLSGLLTDLPEADPPARVEAPARPPRARPPVLAAALFALFLVGAFSVGASWVPYRFEHVPWLLLGLIAVLIWRRDRYRWRYHYGYRYRRRDLDDRP